MLVLNVLYIGRVSDSVPRTVTIPWIWMSMLWLAGVAWRAVQQPGGGQEHGEGVHRGRQQALPALTQPRANGRGALHIAVLWIQMHWIRIRILGICYQFLKKLTIVLEEEVLVSKNLFKNVRKLWYKNKSVESLNGEFMSSVFHQLSNFNWMYPDPQNCITCSIIGTI